MSNGRDRVKGARSARASGTRGGETERAAHRQALVHPPGAAAVRSGQGGQTANMPAVEGRQLSSRPAIRRWRPQPHPRNPDRDPRTGGRGSTARSRLVASRSGSARTGPVSGRAINRRQGARAGEASSSTLCRERSPLLLPPSPRRGLRRDRSSAMPARASKLAEQSVQRDSPSPGLRANRLNIGHFGSEGDTSPHRGTSRAPASGTVHRMPERVPMHVAVSLRSMRPSEDERLREQWSPRSRAPCSVLGRPRTSGRS